MAVTISENTYSGEVLNDLIAHAVHGNDTMDEGLVHVKAGIQHKYVIPTIKMEKVIQDNVPTPSSSNSKGDYTLGERYLEPNDFMVYVEFNPRDWEEYWRPFQPKGNLVFRNLPPKLQAEMLRLLIAQKDAEIGEALWMSTKGGGLSSTVTPSGGVALGLESNKYYDGYMKRLLNSAQNDDAGEKVIRSGSTVLDTGEKVEAALYAAWKKCPTVIRKRKTLKFVTSFEIWDLYDQFLSSKTFKNTDNTLENKLSFKGKKIIPINEIPADTIVFAEFNTGKDSNFWVGVDYVNDTEVVKVDHLQANSELHFFQMRMKMDVNIVKPGEIVMHTTYTHS